ncbi:MAG: hypothetical protein ABR986_06780 [Methanomassiliicoccales archaeon]|jgi:hypothetical protein
MAEACYRVGRDRLYNDQLAEAVFGRGADKIEPKIEVLGGRDDFKPTLGCKARSMGPSGMLLSEPVATSRILCSCGAVVELDRSVVGIKHKLGKMVECRKCRNARIAREKEEEDIAFTGIKEEGEG